MNKVGIYYGEDVEGCFSSLYTQHRNQRVLGPLTHGTNLNE